MVGNLTPMRLRVICAVVVALVIAGCTTADTARFEGSGTVIGDSRDVEPFTAIEVGDGIEVFLQIDPAEAEHLLVVHYDDNLLSAIGTSSVDGTLTIEVLQDHTLDGRGRFVTIRVPDVVAIGASGGASLTGEGAATALHITASGGASVDVHAIAAESVVVDASGGARVAVYATSDATVTADGGADVDVFGGPDETDITQDGGATVDLRTSSPGDPSA